MTNKQFVDLKVNELFLPEYNKTCIYRKISDETDKDGYITHGTAKRVALWRGDHWSFTGDLHIELWNPYGGCIPVQVKIEVKQ